MKKQITIISVVLLLIVAALASAGGEAEKTQAGGPVSLSVTLPAVKAGTKPGNEVELMVEKAIGADIDWTSLPTGEERATKINLLMSDKKTMPDVIWFQASNLKEFSTWKEAGILVDLYPYVKEHGPEIIKYYENYYNGDPLFGSYENGRMDHIVVSVSEAAPWTNMVRKVWLEKFGMTVKDLATLDGYVKYLEKCVNNDPDGNGVKDTGGFFAEREFALEQLLTFFSAFGSNPSEFMIAKDGSVTHGAILDESKEGLKYIADLYRRGLIDKHIVQADVSTWSAYEEGKHGALHFATWMTTSANGGTKRLRERNPGDDFIRIEPPTGPTGIKGSDMPSNTYGQTYAAVTTNCEDPAAVIKMLNYIATPENFVRVKFGTEGVDWVKKDGVFSWLTTEEQRDLKGLRMFDVFMHRTDAIANVEVDKRTAEYFDLGAKGAMPLRQKTAFLKTLNRPELSKYKSNLDDLTKTFYLSVITGEKSINDFNSFKEEWLAIGGAEVIKEANVYWSKQASEYKEFRKAFPKM